MKFTLKHPPPPTPKLTGPPPPIGSVQWVLQQLLVVLLHHQHCWSKNWNWNQFIKNTQSPHDCKSIIVLRKKTVFDHYRSLLITCCHERQKIVYLFFNSVWVYVWGGCLSVKYIVELWTCFIESSHKLSVIFGQT